MLLVAGLPAHAVLLISNTPGVGGFGENDIFSTQWNAAEISTGATAYRLDEVVLNARRNIFSCSSPPCSTTHEIVVEIYDDGGAVGTAGSSLVTLVADKAITGSFANISFTSASDFILAANSTFWIVAKSDTTPAEGGNIKVKTDPNAYTGDAAVLAATDKTQYFCADGGNDCLAAAIPVWTVSPGSPGGSNEMAYSVSGTAVPEPTTLLLIGLGLAGLAGTRRRRGAAR